MSQIDDLIAEHCPDGVEFIAVGEIAGCYSGATPASGVAAYWEDGTIPWMSSGEVSKGTVYDTDNKITQAGFDSCSTKMIPPNAVVIALAGQGKTRGTVARTRLSLCTNQSLCSIIPKSELITSDFLYYFLSTQYQQLRDVSSGNGARGGLNLQIIRSYRVPVPPLEIQREIVKVLDTFTKLEARRRQYQYYRDALLTFGERTDADAASKQARITTLSEITTSIASGRNKQRMSEGAYPVYGSTGLLGYSDEPAYSGDALLVARVGANAGLVNAVSGDFDVSDNTLVVRPSSDWDVRFAFHQMTHMNLNQYAVGGGQPLVTGGLLKNLKVLLPPLEEQERIASILDKFDVLVNDLSSGLPAEIKARRQQYEHYRDRLLSFPEKAQPRQGVAHA